MDEAGWRVGADGIRQKTVKAGADAAGDQKLINDALVPIAKDNYRRLGVVLKPQVLISTRCWRSARRATMTGVLSTSTLNDPHDGVRDFISRESETGYHNPQVDALIAGPTPRWILRSASRCTISCIRRWRTIRR